MFVKTNKVIFVFVALVTMIVSLAAASIQAKAPRPGTISALDNTVGGEPGEDPHLKVEPIIKIAVVWSDGSSNEAPSADQIDREMYSTDATVSYTFDSAVNVVWRLIINSLIDTWKR